MWVKEFFGKCVEVTENDTSIQYNLSLQKSLFNFQCKVCPQHICFGEVCHTGQRQSPIDIISADTRYFDIIKTHQIKGSLSVSVFLGGNLVDCPTQLAMSIE